MFRLLFKIKRKEVMRKSKYVDLMIGAIEDKKGEDIEFYDLRKKNPFYDYVIVCTSRNDKNGLAIADSCEEVLETNKHSIKNIEGKDSARWIIIDAGDIIIHIFNKEERNRINLDELLNRQTNVK